MNAPWSGSPFYALRTCVPPIGKNTRAVQFVLEPILTLVWRIFWKTDWKLERWRARSDMSVCTDVQLAAKVAMLDERVNTMQANLAASRRS